MARSLSLNRHGRRRPTIHEFARDLGFALVRPAPAELPGAPDDDGAGIGRDEELRQAIALCEPLPVGLHRRSGIERLRDLARGPGRLAAALRIDRRLDGLDLCREGPLWLARDENEPGEIARSIRIGISRDADRLLRFYLSGNPFVSGPRALNLAR